MAMTLEGKRVLVTGSTRNIGRATVRAFLEGGASIAVTGPGGRNLVPAPRGPGSAAACRRVVHAAIDDLDGLDVLVNIAGIHVRGP